MIITILKFIGGWFLLSVMGAMIFSQVMELGKRRNGETDK